MFKYKNLVIILENKMHLFLEFSKTIIDINPITDYAVN